MNVIKIGVDCQHKKGSQSSSIMLVFFLTHTYCACKILLLRARAHILIPEEESPYMFTMGLTNFEQIAIWAVFAVGIRGFPAFSNPARRQGH